MGIVSAMSGTSKPGGIHLRIIEVMKRFPSGISGGQIRQELEKEGLEASEQTHLDRRKRDLKKWFVITREVANIEVGGKNRKVTLYSYGGVRRKVLDEGQVSQRDRAEVIHDAHGRCQMCGGTIERHGIVLVVDHRKPRDWARRPLGSVPGGGLEARHPPFIGHSSERACAC